MECKNCESTITIKNTYEWVSLKCRCQIIIIYPDGTIITKNKKEYDPNYKK